MRIYFYLGTLFFLIAPLTAFSPVFFEYHLQCDENSRNPNTSRCTFSEARGDENTVWHYEPAADTRWTYKIRPDAILEVVFSQCSIPEIPKGLFNYYKNVRSVIVSRAQLIGIYKYTFVGATRLHKLDLSFNNVTAIADKVFGECTALAHITLSDNKIERLGEFAFHGLRLLQSLDLRHNRIRQLHPAIFHPLGNLEILILVENDIDALSELQFIKSPRLSHVDLSHNQLKEINGKCFSHLKNLTVLNLAHNYIREFSTEFFLVRKLFLSSNVLEYVNVFHDIEILDATDNHIKGLKIKPGINLGALKIRNNSISDVSQFCSIPTLTSLDLSHNPVVLHESTLKPLTHLQSLDLQHCHLKSLPKNVFAGLKSLQNLNVAHNDLDYFDLSWALSVQGKLMNLYLDGNRLTDFNFNAIKHKFDNFSEIGLSNNAFDCNYLKDLVAQIRTHKVKVFFEEPVTTTPNVEFIGCIDKPSHLIACDEKFGTTCTFTQVLGDLREYWRFETVVNVLVIEEIIFSGSRIKEIPRGIFQYFTNAHSLVVSECYVEEIYEYSFAGGQHLTHLDLSRNKIRELKHGVFVQCISVTEILVAFNEIYLIEPGAFEGLANLQTLSLGHNKITQLDRPLFTPLTHIFSLDLSNNDIYVIDEYVFAQNPNLQIVELSNNDIKQLPQKLFEHQKNVALNVTGNELTVYESIPNVQHVFLGQNDLEVVQIPTDVTSVVLENNKIKTIQVSEYSEYLVLELILKNNSLEDIKGLSKLTNLESLDLSYNQPQLQANSFQNNRKVKYLSLVHCEITTIYETLLVGLSQLEVLDLSKNPLKTFDVKNIKTNQDLKSLKLESSELTEITNIELLQNHLPHLQEIYLGGNNFECQYLRKLIDFLRKRGIKVVTSNPQPSGPNSVEGISCVSSVYLPPSTGAQRPGPSYGNDIDDVEIMQPGLGAPEGKFVQGPREGEPVCCQEIVELRAKVRQLEIEIKACKQQTAEYVNQAMEFKKAEIERDLKLMVQQLLNQKSQQANGGTYLHSRFQKEEFSG